MEKPNEFFDKYGSYILTLMQMFKYGITTANAIDFLETRHIKTTNIDMELNETELDKIETLEGVDLGQIESYLKVNDEARVLETYISL
ncbi:hypothetical protein BGX21_004127 [Mortierella sp. AD011]|nr:hypothetical protein BGX20_004538 [Mortierella sp. AD010]KAF9400505.1 hypothetical protein BGX21_004127 [Mortierella sp. AD011]